MNLWDEIFYLQLSVQQIAQSLNRVEEKFLQESEKVFDFNRIVLYTFPQRFIYFKGLVLSEISETS